MRGQRVRANRSSGSETSGSGKSVRRRLGARRRPDRIKDKVDEVEPNAAGTMREEAGSRRRAAGGVPPEKGTRGERVEIKVLVDVAGAWLYSVTLRDWRRDSTPALVRRSTGRANDGKAEEAYAARTVGESRAFHDWDSRRASRRERWHAAAR